MTSQRLENRWDAAYAASLSAAELLLYRSNLLGSDRRITNYGGGNTSAKILQTDPLSGAEVEVLWVKGSGGDMGSMALDGFATLYLDKLRTLPGLYGGPEDEDRMVDYLPHCTFNLNRRAASIDTPLHAFIDHRHIDHMHPDAVIALAAAEDSRVITERVYGRRIGWLPWRRPGFELGLMLRRFVEAHPQAEGVVLESHGLFTWGTDAQACYDNTLRTINAAIAWLAAETRDKPAFGGVRHPGVAPAERQALAAALMPEIRGRIGAERRKIGHFDDSPAVLEFVNSPQLTALAARGTACPDHFLRTKIWPLVIDIDPAKPDLEACIAGLDPALADYRARYRAYYDACKHDHSPPMRDPNPVIYLVAGVGLFSFAADKATARIAAEFYLNAINVMRDADRLSAYRGLAAQEAFDIEYWPLEEAKLQRAPAPLPLSGRVALVTGGGGGIGRAICARYLAAGACVIAADIDAAALSSLAESMMMRHGPDRIATMVVDVTDEAAVSDMLARAARGFGGIDILVSNAGISSAAPIAETSLALWQRNMDILATGYFLVSRAAFRLLQRQKIGGSVVFIGSKNALVASPDASAYCTAKAAEIHLARCLALEGAPLGIRVNVVNPDAVLRGSKIWSGEWRTQRAKAYNTAPERLEDHYRDRSLLKQSVLPEDIAEAAYFLGSDMSAKSTGNIVNVDAGHAAAFTR